MKKLISTLLCALMLLSLSVSALALEPSDEFYVADYTSHLSQSLIDNIVDLNGQLENLCDNAQIVVVMVDYFGDVYADEIAVSIFNDWEISSNGMLLVVSTEEFRGGLTVGEDIEPAFSDSLKNEYLDKYFWTDFDKRNYDTAVESLMIALAGWYSDKYDVSLTFGTDSISGEYYPEGTQSSGDGIIVLIFFAVFILIIVMAAISSDRQRYNAYYSHMGIPAPVYRPIFIFTGPHRHWRAPPPPPPGGFGGRGGSFRTTSSRPVSRPTTSRPTSRPSYRPTSRPSGGFRPSGGGFGGRSGGGFGGRR